MRRQSLLTLFWLVVFAAIWTLPQRVLAWLHWYPPPWAVYLLLIVAAVLLIRAFRRRGRRR